MLTQKVNKKKDQVMIIIIIVIVLIVAIILLKNYVFKGGGEISNNLITNGGMLSNSDILKEAPKSFQSDILKSDKYQNLVNNNIKIKKIEELNVGNKNPFMAEDSK